MGRVNLPISGTVYVDTNVIIYKVERIEPEASAAAELWNALHLGNQQVATSELALLEVLVKPMREKNHTLVDHYRTVLLGTLGLTCIPIVRPILERAAQIRATHRLRSPDAIHAATALEQQCALFVTNDSEFQKVTGLPVVSLHDL